MNANNVCECPVDQKGLKKVWSESDQSCNCPANLPLWNGKYCVICPSGTEFDPKEKQCYHCPDGFIRDTSSHACVPGLWKTNWFFVGYSFITLFIVDIKISRKKIKVQ